MEISPNPCKESPMALGFTGRCKESSNESHYMLAIKCDTFLQSPLGGTASCPQPTEWDRPPNTQKNAEIKEVACEFLVFASCMFGTSPKWTLFCRRGKDRAWRNFCPFCEILSICKLRHHRRSASFQKSLHCFPLKKKHKAYDGNSALHT